ncbi:MAG TPA: SDR family oxidoreductase [Candidatus Dormibacteraeota bacterium]|nr:SDR family oxidoreductase [Candidatus Dormibacteraeota bacterium]
MDLNGKVIVVTGAARGIGRALVRRFATERPAVIVAADVNGDGARLVADEVRGEAVQCDVSHEQDVVHLIEKTEASHGRIDLFCSNAGIAVAGGPEASDEDWQRIWEVNVLSHVFVARHVIPGMLARREGYIVGTVSAAGLLNHLFATPYGVTKAAALSLFEWLSIAHGDSGIRVSCLCPQGVKTDMLAAERRLLRTEFLTASALEPEVVADAVVEGIAREKFLILPHPEVAEYFQRKATDYDRWLRGMRRLRANLLSTPH